MANQRTDKLVLYARDLCGNDPDHWKLVDEKEPNGVHVEVAELLHVPGFVIPVMFKTENLIPGHYQVALIVKIIGTTPNSDPDKKLQIRYCQTNGDDPKDFTVDLNELPKDEWHEITFPETLDVNQRVDPHGQVHFLITETGPGYWDEKFLVDAVLMALVPPPQKLTKKLTKKSG